MANKKVALQLRLDEVLHTRLKAIAEKEMRSLNAEMEYLLMQGVERYEEEHGSVKKRGRRLTCDMGENFL